jgi:adhesin transport system membrane fusion protein
MKKSEILKRYNYTEDDIEYMRALGGAVLQRSTSRSRTILMIILFFVVFFITWASMAEMDEIVRGSGKVIPSGQNQKIQHLEGGIVSEILVSEGDIIKKGQTLLKIDNQKSFSSYAESQIKINELKAKATRLYAEAYSKNFDPSARLKKEFPKLVENEKSLFHSNREQHLSKISILKEQLIQKKSVLKDEKNKLSTARKNYHLKKKEVDLTRPLVKRRVVSQVDFMNLEAELNNLLERVETSKTEINKINSQINELYAKIEESELEFQNKAKKELNEVLAKVEYMSKSKDAFEDQVNRSDVKAPVNGIIKQMFINTVGGVVRPGMDLVEVVPTSEKLIIEAKIKPSDIAFLHPNQKAVVKFTAYDFTIHGGLEGKVIQISADTIIDEQSGDSFYLVRIKTDKNYLGSESKPLAIMTGMMVNVDIVTGKKTILSYILKPILRSKHYAFSER